MLRNSEGDSEILLGNKQLLGIFFVIALLLGVAFAGGYVVGHGSSRRADAVSSTATAPETSTAQGGETHALPADVPSNSSTAVPSTSSDSAPARSSAISKNQSEHASSSPSGEDSEPALGAKHGRSPRVKSASTADVAGPPPASLLAFTPQSGQTFLQVAAVSRDEAAAIADVLYKKGFRAHAVPKPGNTKIYRIIIGPVRDATDLSATRENLRKTGFREVIVQRY